MNLSKGSSYSGSIIESNTAKNLSLSLESSSTLTLTGETYIAYLKNEVSDNNNINLNGNHLYVNGKTLNLASRGNATDNVTKIETDDKK